MIRLLRLIPQFRALESECQDLRASLQDASMQNLLIQDRLDATLQDRAKLWDLMQESVRHERITYQAHLNLQWQREGHPAPYPDAPQMAEQRVPHPISVKDQVIPRPLMPSERVQRQTQRVIRDLIEQYEVK
jgi:hypothetical protein